MENLVRTRHTGQTTDAICDGNKPSSDEDYCFSAYRDDLNRVKGKINVEISGVILPELREPDKICDVCQ